MFDVRSTCYIPEAMFDDFVKALRHATFYYVDKEDDWKVKAAGEAVEFIGQHGPGPTMSMYVAFKEDGQRYPINDGHYGVFWDKVLAEVWAARHRTPPPWKWAYEADRWLETRLWLPKTARHVYLQLPDGNGGFCEAKGYFVGGQFYEGGRPPQGRARPDAVAWR